MNLTQYERDINGLSGSIIVKSVDADRSLGMEDNQRHCVRSVGVQAGFLDADSFVVRLGMRLSSLMSSTCAGRRV